MPIPFFCQPRRRTISFNLQPKHWALTALATCALAAPAFAQTPVFLYDNFSSPAASNSLWTKDAEGAGTVTFTNSAAVFDMSSPTIGKAARLDFPTSFTLNQINNQFRITWDQQIIGDNINAFGSGFALLSGGTVIVAGEQVGRQNDGANASPFLPHHFSLYAENGTGTFGTVDGGTAEHHFDFSISGSTVSLSIYAYNSAFDATPDAYLSAGTLLETLTDPLPALNPNAPLSLLFADEDFTGTDGFTQTRAVVSLDNVFLSATTPEPATAALLALPLLAALAPRRRKSPSR